MCLAALLNLRLGLEGPSVGWISSHSILGTSAISSLRSRFKKTSQFLTVHLLCSPAKQKCIPVGSAMLAVRYAVRFVQKMKVAIMARFLPDFLKFIAKVAILDSRQNLCRVSPQTYEIRVRSSTVADS